MNNPGRDTSPAPSRLSHEAAESLISARLDAPLDAASNRALLAHLATCSSCRAFADHMSVMARGLRDIGEKPAGYEISVSRTIAAPVNRAFKAWSDDQTRKRWLREDFTVRKSTANKTLRINWPDGTDLVVAFYPKGEKSQVVAQHAKLKDAKSAARMKTFWGEALDRLKDSLET